MKINYKFFMQYKQNFEELLEIWACFRKLIAEKYAWQELPEKFSLADCAYSEYEDVPFATVHIYSYDYDISFQKGNLQVAINMQDDDISINYSIVFSNSENSEHDFALETHSLRGLNCNTKNPFYKDLIATVHSIPRFEKITPFEITFSKQNGSIDDKALWPWMKNTLSTLDTKLTLPKTISLRYNNDKKEYSCKFTSTTFELSVYLNMEENKFIYFFAKHKNKDITLSSTPNYTHLKLSYGNPDKEIWEDSFNKLDLG